MGEWNSKAIKRLISPIKLAYTELESYFARDVVMLYDVF